MSSLLYSFRTKRPMKWGFECAGRSCSLLVERCESGSASSRRSVAAIAGRTQRESGSSSAEHLHGKHHNAKRPQGQHHKHGHSVEQRQQVFHGSLTRWRFLGHSRWGSLLCDRNIISWPSDGAGARERKPMERAGIAQDGWSVPSPPNPSLSRVFRLASAGAAKGACAPTIC